MVSSRKGVNAKFLRHFLSQHTHLEMKTWQLKEQFTGLAAEMAANEDKIMNELNEVQGVAMDIDGYYFPSPAKASDAMRPSETFNSLLNVLA